MFNVITYLSHTDSEISVVLDDTLPVASLRTDFPFWEQRVTTSRRSKKRCYGAVHLVTATFVQH